MAALRELAAIFDIEWKGSALENGLKKIDQVKGSLAVLGGFLAATGFAITRFAAGFEQDAGALEDTANALGLTTTQLQEMDVAATRAGLSVNAFRSSLQRFEGNVSAAAEGGGAAAGVFSQLRIALKDASGGTRNTSDLMDDLAVALDSVEDPAKRTHLATELFGRSGARLATILHSGSGGLAELRQELQALGGGLTKDGVETAGKFGDELDRLKIAFDSVRSGIAVGLLPPLTFLVEKVREGIVWVSKLAQSSSIVQAIMVALGVAAAIAGGSILAAFMPVILAMAPWIAGIAAVVLILDDLITMFRGGKSVIGDFIDSMFGVGTAAGVVRSVKIFWDDLTLAIGKGWDLLKEFARGMAELLPQAWNELKDALAPVGAFFNGLWNQIKSAFDGILRLAEKIPGVGGLVRGLRSALSGAGSAVGGAIAGTAGEAASDANQLFLGSAATVQRATVRGLPGAAGGVSQVNRTEIHVHPPSGDPHAIAAEVQRRQRDVHADAMARAHAARREHREGT